MNLFASFATNNTLWLLWYRMVLADPEVLSHNGVRGFSGVLDFFREVLEGSGLMRVIFVLLNLFNSCEF